MGVLSMCVSNASQVLCIAVRAASRQQQRPWKFSKRTRWTACASVKRGEKGGKKVLTCRRRVARAWCPSRIGDCLRLLGGTYYHMATMARGTREGENRRDKRQKN